MTSLAPNSARSGTAQLEELVAEIFRIAMGRHIALHGDFAIAQGVKGPEPDELDMAVAEECGIQIMSCRRLSAHHAELVANVSGSLLDCFGDTRHHLKCRVLFVPGGRELYEDTECFTGFKLLPEGKALRPSDIGDVLQAVDVHRAWLLLTNRS